MRLLDKSRWLWLLGMIVVAVAPGAAQAASEVPATVGFAGCAVLEAGASGAIPAQASLFLSVAGMVDPALGGGLALAALPGGTILVCGPAVNDPWLALDTAIWSLDGGSVVISEDTAIWSMTGTGTETAVDE